LKGPVIDCTTPIFTVSCARASATMQELRRATAMATALRLTTLRVCDISDPPSSQFDDAFL
jgi:hypothetical protein